MYIENKIEGDLLKKYNYTIKQLMKILFIENPNIDKDECYKNARFWRNEIEKSNQEIKRNTNKYFNYNLPLSIFNNEDDEVI